MSKEPARLPIHNVTILAPRGPAWHLTVACPEKDRTVDADTCASCQKLKELLPADEEGRSWILCEPTPSPTSTRPATADLASARVADVMTRDVVCAREELPVRDVLNLLVKEGFDSAPIVDSAGALRGVVTKAEVTRMDGNVDVARVMSPSLSLHENTPLAAAAKEMAGSHVHTAAVVDDDHKIVGVLSALDVLRYVASLAA